MSCKILIFLPYFSGKTQFKSLARVELRAIRAALFNRVMSNKGQTYGKAKKTDN